jgi:hypothetical protein
LFSEGQLKPWTSRPKTHNECVRVLLWDGLCMNVSTICSCYVLL